METKDKINMSDMDALATDVLNRFNSLVDEEVETNNGSIELIHHINGNKKDQLVVGISRKGKTIFAQCPVCNNGFKSDGVLATLVEPE